MVEPLTDDERTVRRETSLRVVHTEGDAYTHRTATTLFVAEERLRYEATLQDVEAQLEELALAVLNTVAYDEPLQGAHKLARAAIGDGEVASSREIIKELAEAAQEMLDAWDGYEMLAALDHRIQKRVAAAIKEATS